MKYLNLKIFKSLLLSEPCCQQRYYQSRELLGIDRIEKVEEPEYFRPGTLGKIQKCLWDLFEKPHTSLGARVSDEAELTSSDSPPLYLQIVAIISICFIVISTVVLTLNTLPYFQVIHEVSKIEKCTA